jgi:quercetin dioxygenase-like cupin family protein
MADRVFLRGIEAGTYSLRAERQARLRAPHVIAQDQRRWRDENTPGHEDASPSSRAKWMVGPGDDPFLTQTVQCHFVTIAPGGANGGHGHQNEAAFFILEGEGYEVHDGRRYEWAAGDLVVVHPDSKHQHFNASGDRRAVALVVKPKCTWMMLGLTQQGRGSTIPDGEEAGFGPREDWSQLWTPGVDGLRKVVHSEAEPWVDVPGGRVKWLADRSMDVRLFGIDVWLEEASGSERVPHWHMADELYYVLEGSGSTLEWAVEADIDDRYYARVAKEPRRHEWRQGDVVYVPQNCVHVLLPDDGPVRLLGARSRLFGLLGYDRVVERPAMVGATG